MGQEQYLIRTGVGFDVDRRSGAEAIGFIESMAETMNTKAMVKSVNGIKARNTELIKLGKDLEKKNDAATQRRKDKVKKSAEETHNQIMKSLPDPKSLPTTKSGKEKASTTKYKKELQQMADAHKKFADRAAAAGIKMKKSMKVGKKDVGVDSVKFAKQGAEARQRQINLMKQMIDENDKLGKTRKKGATAARRDNKHLRKEAQRLIALDKDAIQVEKKEARIKKKNANQYRKDARKLHQENRQELQNIKHRTKAYQQLGQKAAGYVRGLSSGLKNAFVIGSAAAAAFAYKLQPVAESVMEFEKTIINANSVFRESNEVLHEVSDSLVQFGLQYGISTEKSAEGLYQLASAGLSAAESQEVLEHTLKLSMATQGDHNTLAKLTVQTIAGFGMEMSMAGELTDKFAHTIQKSLVEWQDLASSVKFAMPFFVATGQSIDHLLGGIEVLSNRALEAGIAGRGLRQSLAQLTKHAEDNESQFARLGVQTMDNEGNMRDLTDIVNDAKAAFGDVTDLQALTAMLEDMNVRGATAFALLVQNAGEYEAAVKDLANSAGEATAMADTQQESLAMQIQKVKNALMAPFLFSDKIGEANGTLNEFTLRIKEIVDEFVQFFIQGEKGSETVTKFGYQIRDFVIAVMRDLLKVVKQLKKVFLEQEAGLDTFQHLLTLATKPMLIMLKILNKLGPNMITYLVYYKVLAKLLPISTAMSILNTKAMLALALATAQANNAKATMTSVLFGETIALKLAAISTAYSSYMTGINTTMMEGNNLTRMQKIMLLYSEAAAWITKNAAMTMGITLLVVMVGAIVKTFAPLKALAILLFGVAAAFIAMWTGATAGIGGLVIIGAIGAGLAALTAYAAGWGVNTGGGGGAAGGGGGAMPSTQAMVPQMDTGGTFMPRYYDTGGLTNEHGMAVLQKGETVVSRSQNAAGGSSGMSNSQDRVQLLVQGDVYDGDKFADKVSSALAKALRLQNDVGGI